MFINEVPKLRTSGQIEKLIIDS